MYVYLWLKNWFADQEGQDLIEYSLIIALVVVVAIVAMTTLGGSIKSIWESVSASMASAAS
jgi:pilus assembly protein Flp/PilA